MGEFSGDVAIPADMLKDPVPIRAGVAFFDPEGDAVRADAVARQREADEAIVDLRLFLGLAKTLKVPGGSLRRAQRSLAALERFIQ